MSAVLAAPHAKGSTLRSTLRYVEAEHGAGAAAAVLARLGEDERRRVEAAPATGEVPIELLRALWDAVEAEIGRRDQGWPEKSGAYSIQSMGVELYGGILRKKDPLEFLVQPVSLFRLYYQPGNMEVVEAEPGRAVLRLVGFPGDPVFCRRQTGGLLRATELAGGVRPAVRHVRCAVEGDAFCEWELHWEQPQGAKE
ncbi:hypothetical protein [Longimicrobium sp.]|uniref:hypothetical protein n=1 Tax=Longimicrobium sp. TaxID=2029185 RepID=UPI002C71B085|nr:hypothetical protein [Longimicrobium sp.]HSU12738.1 hypothetical protein [Longimicrobium sp.]